MAQEYKPDLAQAARFLHILDPNADSRSLLESIQDGFTFQTFSDIKGAKNPALTKIINSDFQAASGTLKDLNRKRAGVFVTVNETDMKGRKLTNITKIRAIWVEDDLGSGIPLPLEPHLIVETSPGKSHKIILVSGISPEDHKRFQKILIDHYGSDENAKDLSRVLRVPGFYHCKETPFLVRLTHESLRKPYSLSELNAAFSIHAVSKKKSLLLPLPKKETPLVGEYVPLEKGDSVNSILPDITLDKAETYLPPPGEQSRKEWLDVGIMLYNQFNGSREALELFDRWSQSVRAYEGFDDIEKTWFSFGGRTETKLTFKGLIKDFHERTAEEKKSSVAKTIEAAITKADKLLENCNDPYTLTKDVAPKLWSLADGIVALEKDFRSNVMERYGQLCPGKALSTQEANRALKAKRPKVLGESTELPFYINPGRPDWSKDWVWVASEDKFYRSTTGTSCSARGFDGMYNCLLPKGENAPSSASGYALDNMFVGRAMKRRYVPDADILFIDKQGEGCLNSYSPNGALHVPDSIDSVEGREAVKLIKNHISLVCGGWNREAQLVCNFLATCMASNPCIKIRWALCISGVQGDGKTLFGKLMTEVLGSRNTRQINGNTIASGATTSFNGWVEGHRLGLIEEIKWHGHNRHEITNSLKPIITNDVISCHQKGREQYDIDNKANYLLTTNYEDALPLEDGDRRYFILKSKFPLEDIKEKDPSYFKILTKAIESKDVGYMVRFIVDVPNHPDFDPNGHAPFTEAKKNLIRLSKDDMSDIVNEIIEDDGNPLFTSKVVCYAPLLRRVMASEGVTRRGEDRKLEWRFVNALLSLGYIKLTRVRINGERQQLWARTNGASQPTVEWAKNIVEERMSESGMSGDLI